MPRKVTKTMREARKRAIAQKKARRQYQAQLANIDFNWAGSSPSEAELRNSRTVTIAKKRKTEPGSINLDTDFSKSTISESKAKSHGNIRSKMSEEEYQAREEAAQKEIDRKRGQIAPAYNKGAYQYITSEEQVKDVYKK